MISKRFLIVNADDFGLSSGVNRGIFEAFENGIVTSASLMVRGSAVEEAVAYCKTYPGLHLGIHVDLGEWAFMNGNWVPVYQVVSEKNSQEVSEEVARQITTFRDLVGQNPTHIDTHQHFHLREPVKSIMIEISKEIGVPLRHFVPQVRYCGDFYGQSPDGSPLPEIISVGGLTKILQSLTPGFTEMACHPGYGEDLNTMYRIERFQEIKVLCDSDIKNLIKKMEIKLCSFKDFMN